MSTIAVEIKNNKITFAYDSFNHKGQNVFTIGNITIAIDGSLKNIKFLKKYIEEITKESPVFLNDKFAVFDFFDKANFEFEPEDSLFITDSKKVYYFQPTIYTCMEIKEFDANGSGANYAIGAYKHNPNIKKAIEIACECDKESELPVNILEIA